MDKKKNILKIIIVLLCVCAVMLFALIQAGVNIPLVQAYKNNFKHNVSGISNLLGITLPIEMQLYLDDMSEPTPKPTMIPASEQEMLENIPGLVDGGEESGEAPQGTAVLTTLAPVKAEGNDDRPTALDGAANARFAEYGGDMVCAGETYYRGYDKNGKLLWDVPIQMQSPQLTVKGKYVLINEMGAKKISLYNGKKEVFTKKAEGNIITADLSENGDVIAVTEKEYFKGQVLVLNNGGKTIFAWDSGSYNILDAAISKNRSVAVSFLNTDVGADSFITCFSVNGKEKYKTDSFSNTIIFDLQYTGDKLSAISESRCMGISNKGKIQWEYSYGEKVLSDYRIAQNGASLLLFETGGTGEIVVVSAGGKSYEPIKTESMPEVVSIKEDFIAYNSGRDAVISSFDGKRVLRASCSSDIKQMYALDKNEVFCVYSSSVQTKKLKKVKKSDTTVSASPEAQTGE